MDDDQMFGLEVPLESFLQLDSSTPSRFSRHVIAHLPRGRLFASTVHVGRFVQHLMRDIGDSQVRPPPTACLPACHAPTTPPWLLAG